jgi:hypothetical protein
MEKMRHKIKLRGTRFGGKPLFFAPLHFTSNFLLRQKQEAMPNVSDYFLRISVGSNYSNLKTVSVNDEHNPIFIDNEHYTGYICVRLLDFQGYTPDMDISKSISKHEPISNPPSRYFQGKHRRYSMMTQGRFKKEFNGDEIVFGAHLNKGGEVPPGTSIAFRIAKWLDPSIDADAYSETPYMYSPLVSSMNCLAIYQPGIFHSMSPSSDENEENEEEAVKNEEVEEDMPSIGLLKISDPPPITPWQFHTKPVPEVADLLFTNATHKKQVHSYEKRKKYFSSLKNRTEVKISPEHIYCMDFYDAYFDLTNMTVKLPGFSLNAYKYWDGFQKLQYSCRTRDSDITFFVIQYDYVLKSEFPNIESK